MLPHLYNILRAVFIFLDVVLLCVSIYAIIKSWKFRPRLGVSEPELEEKVATLRSAALKERWEGILKKAESGTLESLKLAIIDADNFVDDILRRMRVEGTHIADRLDQLSQDDFISLERLRRAHHIRNQLVHEPDFRISVEEGTNIVKDYETFFREAGAI